jgi:hypothetical protein
MREEQQSGDPSPMHETKTGDSPMNSKKNWTAPVLKVILLNSAQARFGSGADGGAANHNLS